MRGQTRTMRCGQPRTCNASAVKSAEISGDPRAQRVLYAREKTESRVTRPRYLDPDPSLKTRDFEVARRASERKTHEKLIDRRCVTQYKIYSTRI